MLPVKGDVEAKETRQDEPKPGKVSDRDATVAKWQRALEDERKKRGNGMCDGTQHWAFDALPTGVDEKQCGECGHPVLNHSDNRSLRRPSHKACIFINYAGKWHRIHYDRGWDWSEFQSHVHDRIKPASPNFDLLWFDTLKVFKQSGAAWMPSAMVMRLKRGEDTPTTAVGAIQKSCSVQ